MYGGWAETTRCALRRINGDNKDSCLVIPGPSFVVGEYTGLERSFFLTYISLHFRAGFSATFC